MGIRYAIQVMIVTLALLTLSLIRPEPAHACEPCEEILDLDQTVAEADLIVVGQRVAEGPSTGNGPDWITVQVETVLKGDPTGSTIRVNSWDGMCPYGIVIEDDGSYLMFLVAGAEMYNSVTCGQTRFPVSAGVVELADRSVRLEDFAAGYGLTVSTAQQAGSPRTVLTEPAADQSGGTNWRFWLLIGVAGVALLGAAVGLYLLYQRRPVKPPH